MKKIDVKSAVIGTLVGVCLMLVIGAGGNGSSEVGRIQKAAVLSVGNFIPAHIKGRERYVVHGTLARTPLVETVAHLEYAACNENHLTGLWLPREGEASQVLHGHRSGLQEIYPIAPIVGRITLQMPPLCQ